jgi:hypothetical protein
MEESKYSIAVGPISAQGGLWFPRGFGAASATGKKLHKNMRFFIFPIISSYF